MPTKPPFHCNRFKPSRADDRASSTDRGYDAEWRRFRNEFLAHYPLCTFRAHPVARDVCLVAASVVDHIVPLPKGARLDRANCRAVCQNCHAQLTGNLKRTGKNEMPQRRHVIERDRGGS